MQLQNKSQNPQKLGAQTKESKDRKKKKQQITQLTKVQTEKAKSNIQINHRKTRNQNPKQTTEEQEETQGLQ